MSFLVTKVSSILHDLTLVKEECSTFKNNFHNIIFFIDKIVAFIIIDSQILTTNSLSKGVVEVERPLRVT